MAATEKNYILQKILMRQIEINVEWSITLSPFVHKLFEASTSKLQWLKRWIAVLLSAIEMCAYFFLRHIVFCFLGCWCVWDVILQYAYSVGLKRKFEKGVGNTNYGIGNTAVCFLRSVFWSNLLCHYVKNNNKLHQLPDLVTGTFKWWHWKDITLFVVNFKGGDSSTIISICDVLQYWKSATFTKLQHYAVIFCKSRPCTLWHCKKSLTLHEEDQSTIIICRPVQALEACP